YRLMVPAGFNNETIFVSRREYLFTLDRDTGKQMMYTVEPDSNLPVYGLALEATPSTGLVADPDFLFVCFSDRVVRFAVPRFRAAAKLREVDPKGGAKLEPSPQLVRQWNYNTFGSTLLQTPLLNVDRLIAVGGEGTVHVIDKFTGDGVSRFKTSGNITAAVGA